MKRRQSNYVRAGLKRWTALACVSFVLALLPCITWAEEEVVTVPLESLSTYDGITYSNVTITSQTKTHINFKHADGVASVKLSNLPPEEQAKIGYTPPPPPKSVTDYAKEATSGVTRNFSQWLADPRLQALYQTVRTEVNRVLADDDKTVLYSVIGGVACIYILFCLAAAKICRKTGVRPGLLVWLPGFQWIPLLKAAAMSPWNFIWLLIPPINLIVMLVWCFKICRTRDKSPALGFLLLIPVINILAYFYLAFSRQKYPGTGYAHA